MRKDNLDSFFNYPKPNLEDYYSIYTFEIKLMEMVSNGERDAAMALYEDFLDKKNIYNIIDVEDIQSLKRYIISISLLICHSIINKGVSPYSAKAKYHAFAKLIGETSSYQEIKNIGKMMIQAFMQ